MNNGDGRTVSCTCDLCGCEANSIPGTKHRRCSGKGNPVPRPKRVERLAIADRGTWSAA